MRRVLGRRVFEFKVLAELYEDSKCNGTASVIGHDCTRTAVVIGQQV